MKNGVNRNETCRNGPLESVTGSLFLLHSDGHPFLEESGWIPKQDEMISVL